MKNLKTISFWTLFIFNLGAILFTSCDSDDDINIPVTGITLNKTTLTLFVGANETLIAAITPTDATDKTIIWNSNDETKATVDATGKVTGVAVGEVMITAKAGEKTDSCLVTVILDPLIDAGVIINGVKWATRNVDAPGTFATSAEDYGMFYQWNRKMGWSNTNPLVNSDGGATWDSSNAGGDSWTTDNDPSPAGWRVPTRTDFAALTDTEKVDIEWTTQNDIEGYKFIDKTTGNSLFLPTAGYRNSSGTISSVGFGGYYWGAVPPANNVNYAYILYFNSTTYLAEGNYMSARYNGHSVRSVAE